MNNPRVYDGSEEPTLLFLALKHVNTASILQDEAAVMK
jgi:hypothetical protein